MHYIQLILYKLSLPIFISNAENQVALPEIIEKNNYKGMTAL